MNNILTHFAANTTTTMNINEVGNQYGSGSTFTNTVVAIINAVVGVLALVCVIVVIIGGVNYMTSSGDAGKVKKAKDTILYGVIGLVVCVLAFAIVNFVISRIINV